MSHCFNSTSETRIWNLKWFKNDVFTPLLPPTKNPDEIIIAINDNITVIVNRPQFPGSSVEKSSLFSLGVSRQIDKVSNEARRFIFSVGWMMNEHHVHVSLMLHNNTDARLGPNRAARYAESDFVENKDDLSVRACQRSTRRDNGQFNAINTVDSRKVSKNVISSNANINDIITIAKEGMLLSAFLSACLHVLSESIGRVFTKHKRWRTLLIWIILSILMHTFNIIYKFFECQFMSNYFLVSWNNQEKMSGNYTAI